MDNQTSCKIYEIAAKYKSNCQWFRSILPALLTNTAHSCAPPVIRMCNTIHDRVWWCLFVLPLTTNWKRERINRWRTWHTIMTKPNGRHLWCKVIPQWIKTIQLLGMPDSTCTETETNSGMNSNYYSCSRCQMASRCLFLNESKLEWLRGRPMTTPAIPLQILRWIKTNTVLEAELHLHWYHSSMNQNFSAARNAEWHLRWTVPKRAQLSISLWWNSFLGLTLSAPHKYWCFL